MANNFFLNQDPLLYQTPFTQSADDDMLRRHISDSIMQYNMAKRQKDSMMPDAARDYIGELDGVNKKMGDVGVSELMSNPEYVKLSKELQEIIQNEILMSIKWRINMNPTAVKNIERQMDIIKETNNNLENEQRRNILELNDYVKNYSNITFEEYKRIKNGEQSQEKTNNKPKKNTKQE